MQHDIRFHIQYSTKASLAEQIPLTDSLVIGRALTADVVVQDPMSSRQHARFFMQDGLGWVEDLSSSNGSFLNGRRLLEATRIADGDVLSIDQSTFYVAADTLPESSSVKWTRTIGSVLEDIKSGVTGPNTSGVHSALLLQDRNRTFENSYAQFIKFAQSKFPIQQVALWMSPTQRFVDLTRVGQIDREGTDVLDEIDSSLQQLVWNEHHIVCQQMGEQSGLLNTSSSTNGKYWRTFLPIVWKRRCFGLVLLSSDVDITTFLHDLVLTAHCYTKEWFSLEPWIDDKGTQLSLMTSMQWMLAVETSEKDLESFQHRHSVMKAVLRFLIQTRGWSTQEVFTAECAMVLVDGGIESPQLAEKLRWYEQSSNHFATLLVSLIRGIQGHGTVNPTVRLIKLCMDLVDVCLADYIEPSVEVFNRLAQDHNLKESSFSKSDLLTVFQLVQQLNQQIQETQVFRR